MFQLDWLKNQNASIDAINAPTLDTGPVFFDP